MQIIQLLDIEKIKKYDKELNSKVEKSEIHFNKNLDLTIKDREIYFSKRLEVPSILVHFAGLPPNKLLP